ncbi:MAG: hypothetical protein K2N38_15135 [Oscillospiraceae bacterium]|nr:hypothetical protein [Oscillospiraceae bacterium]
MKKIIAVILMCAALMLATACSSGESFSHGTINGTVYTSAFLGLKAEFSEGWEITADSDLAQANGIDGMSDDSTAKALKTNGMLFEMMALKDNGASNVNLVIENLDVTQLGRKLTAEQYVDLALPTITSQYAAAGINDVEAEKSTVSFLGSETSCIKTTVKNNGTELHQTMIPVSKGLYMGVITFTAPDEDGVKAQIEIFKSV